MSVMQEDSKPRSHEFTVRHYGLLEQMLLSGLRQSAPDPDMADRFKLLSEGNRRQSPSETEFVAVGVN